MPTRPPASPFPWRFFLLLAVVSIPFWLAGAAPTTRIPRIPLIDLPISALVAFAPLIAAVILVGREDRAAGVRRLLQRAIDYRSSTHPLWYLPIVFLMPTLLLLEYGVMRLLGKPVPNPQLTPALLLVFALFFLAAIGEETGWTGYATGPLLERWPALTTGVVLGLLWALWHLISFLQTTDDRAWVFWQSVTTVELRLLIVWLFINTGRSLFATVVLHTMSNVSQFSFPVFGSHYDPRLHALVLAIVIVVIATVWKRE